MFHSFQVFKFLLANMNNFKTPCAYLHAAKMQFDGAGSYGNGAAMRVHPVGMAVYARCDLTKPAREQRDTVAKMAKKSALITHSNPFGYNGAIIQVK